MPPAIAIVAAVASVAVEAAAGIALAGEALMAGEAIAGIGAVEAGLGFGESVIGLGGLEAATAGEIAGGLAGIAEGVSSLGEAASGVIADGSLVADTATGSILGAGDGSLVQALVTEGAPAAAETAGAVGSVSLAPAASLSPEIQAALAASNAAATAPIAAAPAVAAAAPAAAAGSGIGSALAGALGVGTAAAAGLAGAPTVIPVDSSMAAINDAARQAAQQGTLNTFLSNPMYAANVDAAALPQLQAMNSAAIANAANPTGGATLGQTPEQLAAKELTGNITAIGANPASATGWTGATNPYGSLTMTPEQAQQAELAGKVPAITSTPAPPPPPPPGLVGPHTGVSITGLGGDQNLITPYQEALTSAERDSLAQKQWTEAGKAGTPWDTPSTSPVVAAPAQPGAPATGSVSVAQTPSSAQSPTPAPAPTPSTSQPTAMSSTTASGATYTGIGPIDSAINSAISHPGTTATNLAVGLTPVGIPNTISGLVGGPTIGGIAADIVAGITPELSAGTAALGLGTAAAGVLAANSGKSGSSTPAATTPTSPTAQDAGSIGLAPLSTTDAAPTDISTPLSTDTATTLRKYLGLSGDPTKYGFGAEQKFYAAQGGYFDADQYFADGGLVSPMQPPAQPTVPPYPTMAFTDGTGPVGSIAQPPGLTASDAYGSDAPHASPMAPSIAASVPTVQPGLTTLAMKNVNASPAPSPVSQNPNVGYAFGQSPLSKL
jgi:hypothetical protein